MRTDAFYRLPLLDFCKMRHYNKGASLQMQHFIRLEERKRQPMKAEYAVLKSCPLFRDIAEKDLGSLLQCLSAREKHYPKGAYLITQGESIHELGIVLTGAIHVVNEDFWGDRALLAQIEPGDLFGEAFCCIQANSLSVSVVAAEACSVLMADYGKVIGTCPTACPYHTRLIQNMLGILACKNVNLTRKLEHVMKRSTRSKLLSFLSEQAVLAGSSRFDIPFTRQELADYLSVDRSAMSGELSRMRDEGLLRFDRSSFELLMNAPG